MSADVGRIAAAFWLAMGLYAFACAAPVDAQNPAPINTFELEAGRRFDRSDEHANESYYRITYKGALVREHGTPFKSASGLDLTAPAPAEAASAVGEGDRNKWTLRYENRKASLGGSILEAAGVQPIVFAGLERFDLRGTAAVGTSDNGTELSIGLETPPMRVPGLSHTEWSNWVVLGVNAQRSDQKNAATSDHAVATYRAFVGKAFGWRKSADVQKTAQKLENDILKQAATLDEAKLLAKKIRASVASGGTPTQLQTLVLDAATDAADDAGWRKTVRAMALGAADAITDQPTVAFYLESSGWRNVQRHAEGPRFKNLLTATLDYWFLPARDDVFLRLRYENGYEWAAPTNKRKQLLLSVAFRF